MKEDKDKEITEKEEVIEESTGTEQIQKEDGKDEKKDEKISLDEELAKEKDKFVRLFAEFDNYKKRTTKERIELFKTAGEEVLRAMLPVLDDFDRAMEQISKSDSEDLKKGVELIHSKFLGVLKSKGLEEVEVKAGDKFDSELHEAITQIPAGNEDMKGKIVDVVSKGYKLVDKVIRFPKVVVGQ